MCNCVYRETTEPSTGISVKIKVSVCDECKAILDANNASVATTKNLENLLIIKERLVDLKVKEDKAKELMFEDIILKVTTEINKLESILGINHK